jgi:hypothetical protein
MERGSYRASRYEPARPRAFHLSLLTGQGLSAWAAHECTTGMAVALGWAGGNDALIDRHLPQHPASISFVSLPEWSALVPDGALAPGTEAKHLALVHGGLPTGAMRDEAVRSLGATCIYVHNDLAERAVLDKFPNARPLPMQSIMIRSTLARCGTDPIALIHRSADQLAVAIAWKHKILLSNTFPAKTAHDMLYYTLLAVEQTGYQAADVALRFGGTHLNNGERDLLLHYFKDCTPVGMPLWPGFVENDQAPLYRWFAVLEQFACV